MSLNIIFLNISLSVILNRNQIIEEERIKILQEHAKNLLGFLPHGILRDSDREFLELPSRTK